MFGAEAAARQGAGGDLIVFFLPRSHTANQGNRDA
jgi:hypothetical protein